MSGALFAASVLGIGALGALTACGVLRASVDEASAADVARQVAANSGWTRDVTTAHYLLVVNVLPAEEMFTADAHDSHPHTEGELIIEGEGMPTGADVRHIEVHVYDRSTGLALTTLRPSMSVLNRTTGELVDVPMTLMQDVNIGAIDRHFGNNVVVKGNSDISVRVSINGEEVTVDGHLD